MKDFEDLQALWNQHDQQLKQQMQLNVEVLKKLNLDKVERKLSSLVRVKAFSLALYMIAAFLLVGYIVSRWPHVYQVLSGAVLGVVAFAICYTSMRELQMILATDYAAPLPDLQQHLLKLRSTVIRYMRVAAWSLPFYFAYIVILFDLFFGWDIIAVGSRAWLLSQLATSLFVMVPLAIWLHRKLVPENADKKWMSAVLRGNGTQIMEAVKLVEEIGEAT